MRQEAPKTDAAKPKRSPKVKQPPAPPVVVAEPQLPPAGAFAKINGRWHVWVANDSLSGSEYGWQLCKPYYSRAHLADEPPKLDTGSHSPRGWIKEDASGLKARKIVMAGREFDCSAGEPDPVPTEVRGIPCIIKWSYGFGTYAVDPDKPFWSPSGFKSFSEKPVATVEEAVAIIEAHIDAPLHPNGHGMGEGGCGGQLMAWADWSPGRGDGRLIGQQPAEALL